MSATISVTGNCRVCSQCVGYIVPSATFSVGSATSFTEFALYETGSATIFTEFVLIEAVSTVKLKKKVYF